MYNDIVDTIGFLSNYDSEVADAMNLELKRQKRNLELIASENIVSPAVMAAMGSVLTNKYAEATPGSATTAAARTLISSRISQSSAQRSCSAQSSRTYRRTPARRLIPQFMWLCSSPATLLWA